MEFKLKAYNIWELGKRENQEDSIFPSYSEIKDTDRLFILCDGMGGHSSGEVASATVCEAMSNSVFEHCPDPEGSFTEDDFRVALDDAFNALDAKDDGAVKKMGTTLTFLKFHNQGCTIAHMGDSRVYHIRPGEDVEDTEILYRTSDHSLVNDLVKIGELTPEEAKHSKQKNVITRAMQPCMEKRPKADIYTTADIRPGDYFLMCSDGILEQMEDDDSIKFIFSRRGGEDSRKVDMLIKATAQNNDNHSAIIVHVTDVINPVEDKAVTVEDTSEPDNDATEDAGNSTGKTPLFRVLRYLIIVAIVILAIFVIYSIFIKKPDTEETPAQETRRSRQEQVEHRRIRPKEKPSVQDDSAIESVHESDAFHGEAVISDTQSVEETSELDELQQISEDSSEVSEPVSADSLNATSSRKPMNIPRFNKDDKDIPESDSQKIKDKYENIR